VTPVPCFWLDATGHGEVGLRRYTPSRGLAIRTGWTCDEGYHSVTNWITVRVPYTVELRSLTSTAAWYCYPRAEEAFPPPPNDDPRWPAACACGYAFTDDDERQVFIQEVFTRADDHQERLLHWNADHPTIPNAEPGALWSALWMRDSARVNPGKPDDSIWLAARCPSISGGYGNDWQVDAAASGGGFWTRTGDPRNPPSLSVTPSIQTGDYHGFLTQGVFTDHVG
jgi:hypothetical protein